MTVKLDMQQPVAFNKVDCPEFMKVTGIKFPVLSDAKIQETAIPHKIGTLDSGVEYGSAKYSIDFVIVLEGNENLFSLRDQLKVWLRGNEYAPSPLSFMEQPDRYVLARPAGTVELDDLIVAGKGSIDFIAANPIIYSYTENKQSSIGNKITVSYLGDADYSPEIEVIVPLNCDTVTLKSSRTKKSITLNGKFNANSILIVDCNKKLIKLNNQINMKILDLTSEWLELFEGANILTATTKTSAVVLTLNIKYVDCWR